MVSPFLYLLVFSVLVTLLFLCFYGGSCVGTSERTETTGEEISVVPLFLPQPSLCPSTQPPPAQPCLAVVGSIPDSYLSLTSLLGTSLAPHPPKPLSYLIHLPHSSLPPQQLFPECTSWLMSVPCHYLLSLLSSISQTHLRCWLTLLLILVD